MYVGSELGLERERERESYVSDKGMGIMRSSGRLVCVFSVLIGHTYALRGVFAQWRAYLILGAESQYMHDPVAGKK